MPLPFAIPPILHVFPSNVNSTATSFLMVSVVIIASAENSFPLLERPAINSSMPFAIGVISSG